VGVLGDLRKYYYLISCVMAADCSVCIEISTFSSPSICYYFILFFFFFFFFVLPRRRHRST
jgi:hypothetical protein